MGQTDADRARAYRQRQAAHKAGDHALCVPGRCPDAPGAAVTSQPSRVTRDERALEGPGQRLWRELDGKSATGEARALILEACRITDRLDKLDRLLNGELEDLLRFRLSDDGTEVTVNVASPLSEARQQATALARLTAELRQVRGVGKTSTPEKGKGGGVADLTARIKRRQAAG